MAKKLDLKKMMLERGEVVGLVVAGVLCVGLIGLTLFKPGRGLFGANAKDKIKQLESPTKQAEAQLRNPENKPQKPDEIAPSPKEAQAKLIKPTLDPLSALAYRGAPLGHDIGGQGAVRGEPAIFNIVEAVAEARAVPLQSYILESVGGKMYVTVVRGEGEGGATGGTPAGGEGGAGSKANERMRGMMMGGGRRPGGGAGAGGATGGGAGLGMMPGGGLGRGLGGVPGQMPPGEGEKKRGKKAFQVLVEKLGSGDTMAEQVRPLRVAVIAASFPFKKQVEEFQRALRKQDAYDVLSEASVTRPGTGTDAQAQTQASFRFLGFELRRRELDGDGKPKGDWAKIDLRQTYRPYVIVTGNRVEEDDPKYEAVKVPGLVMPKLMQFRPENVGKGVVGTSYGGMARFGGMGPGTGGEGGPRPPIPGGLGKDKDKEKDKDKDEKPIDRYPNVEDQLETIKKTLKDLEGKTALDVAQATKQFSDEDFDLFGSKSGSGTGGTGEGGVGGRPPGAGGEGDGTGPDSEKPREIPEHCLVRAIDVTVEPGKTYEYQFRIIMANPNYQRKDVASTEYSKERTLASEWSEQVPIKVTVQEDLRYYAVDQKVLEPKYSGTNRVDYASLERDRVVVLQAHRYLNTVNLKGGAEILVGEIAVAERVPVYRGEYVGRKERVEVPIWQFTLEDFVVATDAETSKSKPGIPVEFGFNARGDQPEAILIDFDPGRHTYERVVSQVDDKVETKKVSDQAHNEVLLMYPDGKLILREGAIDSYEKDGTEGGKRWAEVKEARKRVRGLKKDKKTDGIDRGTGGGGGATGS